MDRPRRYDGLSATHEWYDLTFLSMSIHNLIIVAVRYYLAELLFSVPKNPPPSNIENILKYRQHQEIAQTQGY